MSMPVLLRRFLTIIHDEKFVQITSLNRIKFKQQNAFNQISRLHVANSHISRLHAPIYFLLVVLMHVLEPHPQIPLRGRAIVRSKPCKIRTCNCFMRSRTSTLLLFFSDLCESCFVEISAFHSFYSLMQSSTECRHHEILLPACLC